MRIGFIGLGRMGREMVLHLLEKGVDVVVYNRTKEKTGELKLEVDQLSSRGAKRRGDLSNILEIASPSARNDKARGQFIDTYSLKALVKQLEPPRVIWLMVEHGKPVDDVIKGLLENGVEKDDIIIDGGNSFYKDSIRRNKFLHDKSIHFLDIGTSGGLEGARNGACVMVGGDEKNFRKVEPILNLLAVPNGVGYYGPSGSGHFVKMIHNGVEYGMLQAIGEGFELLEKGPYRLDLKKVASNWQHGSVVRGWLIELLEKALSQDSRLNEIEGVVGGGSTGEWTVITAKELGVEVPVIRDSLEARKRSVAKPSFSGKVVAALRNQFGGHEVKKVK